ncbi:MAG TPA: class I SAM-dependent methyltransferase [Syntrophales bacterium]|nr:class I SAM-dependent methyltransferase [Syntrophales bacterium]
MESASCDQCGNKAQSSYLTMKDPAFPVAGPCSIVKCTSCGLMYTHPRPTEDDLHRLYASYYKGNGIQRLSGGLAPFIRRQPGLLSLWHALCGQYSSTVLRKLSGNVLDIGCGTGDLLDQVQAKGCRAYGVEPNSSAAEMCRRKGLEVQAGSFEHLEFPPAFFDAVILWHSLEHLSSPRHALKKIKKILKPAGRVFIWCPNADSSPAVLFRHFWSGWHLPFHFYHFTPSTITSLAEVTGFRVARLRAVTPEFLFAYSLETWMKQQNVSRSWRTGVIRLLHAAAVRAMLGLLFRIHDRAFEGKGEFLQVELIPVSR